VSLTDITIRSLQPKPKPFKVWDGGELYLEVSPGDGNGGAGNIDSAVKRSEFLSASIPT
jgi:hypothetical protein